MKQLKIPLMDKYIFKEAMRPYFVGVVIITIVMLSNFLYQVADMIIMQDVPIDTVLELLLYQLPEIIVETFPVAVLFAIMSGIGRLNREREITALRMGGFSIYRLAVPLIIFGIIVSGMTYVLNENVVPWTNHRARNIIREAALQDVMPDVREDVFFEGPDNKVFHIGNYNEDTQELERVIIFDRESGSEYPEMITANTGEMKGNEWILRDGHVHRYGDEGRLELAADFGEMEFVVEEDMDRFLARQRTPAEMSRDELREEIELFQRSGIDVTSLLVEYHMKLALPFTSLVFVLIGTPLSLGNKESRAVNLGLTVIIIFSYYVLVSFSRSFGRSGAVHPLTAAWMPHIIFTGLGILLIIFREKWTVFLTNLMNKIMIFVLVLLVSSAVFAGGAAADQITFYGDQFEYDSATGEAVLTGNIYGQFMVFNFRAEELTVVGEEGQEAFFQKHRDFNLWDGDITGCDYDKPHYYFSSPHMTLYPGDRLVGRHVVFWELDGRLPLFYWPYLVIYLDERQRLFPEVGYHEERGYFIRSGYQYLLAGAYPGLLLLDYYSRSGPVFGFNQDLLPLRDERELEWSFLYQEDHEDLGLFDFQTSLEFHSESEDWDSDSWLEYTSFPEYSLLEGEADLKASPEDSYLRLEGDVFRENYFAEEDEDQDITELSYDLRYTTELPDNIRLAFELDQDIEPREDEVLQRWSSKFELERRGDLYDTSFILERDAPELPDPDDEDDDEEEDGISFMRLPEMNFDFRVPGPFDAASSLGRYYEDASDLWGIRQTNEIDYEHSRSLPGPFSLSLSQLFRSDLYHLPQEEADSYWQQARLSHNSSTSLLSSPWSGADFELEHIYWEIDGESPFSFDEIDRENKLEATMEQEIGPVELISYTGYDFIEEEYLDWGLESYYYPIAGLTLAAETYYDLNQDLWGELDLASEYELEPWYFLAEATYDIEEDVWGEMDLEGAYDLKPWYFAAATSYDIGEDLWGELDLETTYEKEPMSISAETSYDIEEEEWDLLELIGSYDKNPWNVTTGIRYDVNDWEISRWDLELLYQARDFLSLQLETIYDFEDETFDKAGIKIRRHFHCRSIAFSYDHIEGEYRLEYSLDIFPQQPISFSSTEDETFFFDLEGGIDIGADNDDE